MRKKEVARLLTAAMSAAMIAGAVPATPAMAENLNSEVSTETEVQTEADVQGETEVQSESAEAAEYAVSGRASVSVGDQPGQGYGGEDQTETGKTDEGQTDEGQTEEYKYVYAGLTWEEYWKNEGVYEAGNTDSSSEKDSHGEYDKGAFDAVSRATTNHGLHRGSFQCNTVITDENGDTYPVSHWSADGATLYLTDGTSVGFAKGVITKTDGTQVTMESYEVDGLKYVPVAVKAEDYEAFCKIYTVVENDGTLVGGYSENKLSAYTKKAEVTANTNGLKTAVKNSDGSFSFEARKNDGTDSGIKDESLKEAEGVTAILRDTTGDSANKIPATGAYGEFIRVDLTANYGDLGSNLQAAKWTYYGSDSTRTTPLASYGTKFAADNWMHKVMGVQLGLTDSIRCQLPAETDGTGYWRLTVYALGYKDYTFDFEATEENIVKDTKEEVSTESLETTVAEAKKLNEKDYTAASWAAMQTELEEAEEILAREEKSQAEVNEAESHLKAAIADLVKLVVPGKATSVSTAVSGINKVKVTWKTGKNAAGYYVLRSTDKAILKAAATTTNEAGLKSWATKYASRNATYKKTTALSFTDTVATGKTYYYLVVAYSKDGVKNAYSASDIRTVSVPAAYKVTFSKNGGSTVSSTGKTVVAGKTYGTLPTAARKGYVLKGWYTAKSGGKKVASSTKVALKANQTLYAQWTKVTAPAKAAAPAVKNVSGKKMSVSYKKVSGAAGYAIAYSTDAKFKNSKITLTTSLSKTVTGLQKGKTYYVKVRAYKLDSQKNRIYGAYSSVKTVKISK